MLASRLPQFQWIVGERLSNCTVGHPGQPRLLRETGPQWRRRFGIGNVTRAQFIGKFGAVQLLEQVGHCDSVVRRRPLKKGALGDLVNEPPVIDPRPGNRRTERLVAAEA